MNCSFVDFVMRRGEEGQQRRLFSLSLFRPSSFFPFLRREPPRQREEEGVDADARQGRAVRGRGSEEDLVEEDVVETFFSIFLEGVEEVEVIRRRQRTNERKKEK